LVGVFTKEAGLGNEDFVEAVGEFIGVVFKVIRKLRKS